MPPKPLKSEACSLKTFRCQLNFLFFLIFWLRQPSKHFNQPTPPEPTSLDTLEKQGLSPDKFQAHRELGAPVSGKPLCYGDPMKTRLDNLIWCIRVRWNGEPGCKMLQNSECLTKTYRKLKPFSCFMFFQVQVLFHPLWQPGPGWETRVHSVTKIQAKKGNTFSRQGSMFGHLN